MIPKPLRSIAALAPLWLAACGPLGPAESPARSPLADEWFGRAEKSFRVGDFEDASESAATALKSAPKDPEIRLLAARIALARLELEAAVKYAEALTSPEGLAVLARALWHLGELDAAGEVLERLLQNPKVRDPWAKDAAKLTRSGSGRRPYKMEGEIVALAELPHVIDAGSGPRAVGAAHVVRVDLDGESVFALVATGASEVFVDSSARREPAWISIRVDKRITVRDVPAFTADLTPLSRKIGIPISMLIGSSFLRHTRATFDRRGGQFIVRRYEPPPPPEGTGSRVPLYYLSAGAMTARAGVSRKRQEEVVMHVDTSRPIYVGLEESGWQKVGIPISELVADKDTPSLRRGVIPTLKLGAYDLGRMPAYFGLDLGEALLTTGVDVAGVIGADLLSTFRVTFIDEGRSAWFEIDPGLIVSRPTEPTAPTTSSTPPVAPSAPASSAPAPPKRPPAPPGPKRNPK